MWLFLGWLVDRSGKNVGLLCVGVDVGVGVGVSVCVCGWVWVGGM